ncbi:hypothetical protein [Bradyrhizobium centrolobii]|uniref:hypothetical protein n=1 Tax=Bradyrhizobium centrolobii TaxID=1505087 RepID=UPI001FD9369C|nr:hypothetical protein [Bradyrhizobium centrolobii]
MSDAHAIAAVHVSVSRVTYANLLRAETLDQFSVERRAKQWHVTIKERDRTDIAVFVAEDAADNRDAERRFAAPWPLAARGARRPDDADELKTSFLTFCFRHDRHEPHRS